MIRGYRNVTRIVVEKDVPLSSWKDTVVKRIRTMGGLNGCILGKDKLCSKIVCNQKVVEFMSSQVERESRSTLTNLGDLA